MQNAENTYRQNTCQGKRTALKSAGVAGRVPVDRADVLNSISESALTLLGAVVGWFLAVGILCVKLLKRPIEE